MSFGQRLARFAFVLLTAPLVLIACAAGLLGATLAAAWDVVRG
jgi:hypothetical protein